MTLLLDSLGFRKGAGIGFSIPDQLLILGCHRVLSACISLPTEHSWAPDLGRDSQGQPISVLLHWGLGLLSPENPAVFTAPQNNRQ